MCKSISCPYILENGSYENTDDNHNITFVYDLFRNKIFNDYFIKMQKYNKEIKLDNQSYDDSESTIEKGICKEYRGNKNNETY